MEREALVRFLFYLLVATLSKSEAATWRHRHGLGKEKVTTLHFYFHDQLGGKNATSVMVAKAAVTDTSPTQFGAMFIADDPLTEGPDPASKVIGRAQGLYALASQNELGLIMAIEYGFTQGKYNGSSLSICGRNRVSRRVREMPIVGGTGFFRLARGFAIATTYFFNVAKGIATVEYNVTVIHY